MEIIFQTTINNLCLSIRLRVMCKAHAQLSVLQLKKSILKSNSENRISITNSSGRHAMWTEDMVHTKFNNVLGWIEMT